MLTVAIACLEASAFGFNAIAPDPQNWPSKILKVVKMHNKAVFG
jgi:hypothetical protein